MMSDRKNDDSLGLGPVNERERKILDENAAGTGALRRTRQGEGKGSCGSILHLCCEPCAQPGLGFAVMDDLSKKLETGSGNEPRVAHRASRLEPVMKFRAKG